jgi:hypothetical protein
MGHVSPGRYLAGQRLRTKGKENTVERGSVVDKVSGDRHLISSNKSIKLSRRRNSQELSGNPNDLEMKIYASLVNIRG